MSAGLGMGSRATEEVKEQSASSKLGAGAGVTANTNIGVSGTTSLAGGLGQTVAATAQVDAKVSVNASAEVKPAAPKKSGFW